MKKGEEEPACIEGECPVGFDLLPEAALRLLEIRGILSALGTVGMGEVISREFEIDLEDLRLLAWIEDQVERLKPQKDKD